MTTASNWLLNWAIAYSTPYMVDAGYGNLQSKVSSNPQTCYVDHIERYWLVLSRSEIEESMTNPNHVTKILSTTES